MINLKANEFEIRIPGSFLGKKKKKEKMLNNL